MIVDLKKNFFLKKVPKIGMNKICKAIALSLKEKKKSTIEEKYKKKLIGKSGV